MEENGDSRMEEDLPIAKCVALCVPVMCVLVCCGGDGAFIQVRHAVRNHETLGTRHEQGSRPPVEVLT